MAGTLWEHDLSEIVRKQAEQLERLDAQLQALKAENARLNKRVEELERKNRKSVAPHSRETRQADPKPPVRMRLALRHEAIPGSLGCTGSSYIAVESSAFKLDVSSLLNKQCCVQQAEAMYIALMYQTC
jgi:hypothetical protein